MIIELSREFENIPDESWINYSQPIENLVSAHREGWHLFVVSKKAGEAILNHCELSRNQKEVLRHHILAKSQILMSEAKSAHISAVCVLGEGRQNSFRENQKIVVDIRKFDNLDTCLPLNLLVEFSETDGEFLKKSCEVLAREIGFSMRTSMKLVNGGGDPTGDIYCVKCNELTPTLCVVDSDKRSRNSSLDRTAKKVVNMAGKQCISTINHYVMPVREMENFIPIEIMRKVYSKNVKVQHRIDVVETIRDFCQSNGMSGLDSYVYYYDMKEGFKTSDVSGACDRDREFLIKIWEICDRKERKFKYEGIPTKSIVGGVSKNLLKNTVEFMDGNGKQRKEFIFHMRESEIWKHFKDMLLTVCSYSAAGGKLPVSARSITSRS